MNMFQDTSAGTRLFVDPDLNDVLPHSLRLNSCVVTCGSSCAEGVAFPENFWMDHGFADHTQPITQLLAFRDSSP